MIIPIRKRTAVRTVLNSMVALTVLIAYATMSPPRTQGQNGTPAAGDWAGYNRTLTSERYAPFDQINKTNVSRMRQICVYDLGLDTSFQTGPVVIGGTLYGTSEMDTFAIDADTCTEKWRIHEMIPPSQLAVNRGVAYLDGRLFRGMQDGRVFAYDAATGKKLWETRIADAPGETVPAAPIAWNGMVFIGNAGSDRAGVKGRMYGLDAATGKILWETYLVPSEGRQPVPGNAAKAADHERMQAMASATWVDSQGPITGGATWTSYSLDPNTGLLYVPGGNPAPDFINAQRQGANLFTDSIVILDARTGIYRNHFSIVPHDYHDWDMAAAPALVTTRAGRRVLAAAPKDGVLYGYDLGANKRMYATPITTRSNVDAPLTTTGTHFCPGAGGGTEWNGPAYSPDTNLFYDGTVDWCVTVTVIDPNRAASVAAGQSWTGAQTANLFGKRDPDWGGWVVATDADTGNVKWRYKASAPVVSGITPTRGGVVFAGDLSGRAFAFDADNGKVLWQSELRTAAGGGVVAYQVNGRQRVAFTVGMRSGAFPGTAPGTAKILVFGL